MSEQAVVASKDGRKTAPVYVVFEGEMMIDAPARYVWRHAINYPSWQNYSVNRHISGPRGQEGEVVLLQKNENVYVSQPYYARTIKVDPERRIIWKTYRDNSDYFGIVEFRLQEVDGRTRFHNNALYEFFVPYEEEGELETFRKERLSISEAVFATVFPRLKELAEREAATSRISA